MQLEVKSEKKNEMQFVLKGEDHTFSRLLVDELLRDEDVEIAQYDIAHPLTGEPAFYLRTKKEAPRDALKKAVKSIKKHIKDLK
jgi:DNA-directed RNA polymerase subunit L